MLRRATIQWAVVVFATSASATLADLMRGQPHPGQPLTCPASVQSNTAYEGSCKAVSVTDKVPSVDACCTLCFANDACDSFTWQDGGRCKLKAGVGCTMTHKTGHYSAVRRAPSPSPSPPSPPSPSPSPSPPTPSPPNPPVPPPVPPTPPPPPPGPQPVPPADQPNIVFVLTDDQDALLNGYDPKGGIEHMAQLNTRVRDNGALYTKYYLAYPLCSPSRSAILTGRYPHNTGFTNNDQLNTSNFHPLQEENTVNVWLQNAGYDTVLIGKYMNGYHGSNNGKYAHYIPPGWTDWYGFQTVDFFGTRVNINGASTKYPEDNYQTDIIANLSLGWMRTKYNRSKPMFMFITPHAPHSPYTPAPRHKGTLSGLVAPHGPAYNMDTSLQSKLPGVMKTLPLVVNTSMNDIFEARAESLLSVDEMIGHLLDELEAQHILDRTFFFFSCDNGYHLGQQRLPPGKREIFEHDINVALIVSGPGVAVGSVRTEAIMNIDFAATFIELAKGARTANASAPDGKSFAAVLLAPEGAAPAWGRSYTLHEGYQSCEAGHGEGAACSHKGVSGWGEVPLYTVITDPRWAPDKRDYAGIRLHGYQGFADAMYCEYTDGGKTFFNHSAGDTAQTNNIYAALGTDLQSKLAKMLAAVVDCKTAEECP